MRKGLPLSEKILEKLHNLCATAPDLARSSEELAKSMNLDTTEVERILDDFGPEGHIKSFTDKEGKKRYYLTGKGIIKVCAFFT